LLRPPCSALFPYTTLFRSMGRLVRGDLGRSIRNGEPVIENVGRRIRPSLQLAAFAMTISLLVAFPVGIVSAVRRNTSADRVATRSEEHTSELQSRGHLVCR